MTETQRIIPIEEDILLDDAPTPLTREELKIEPLLRVTEDKARVLVVDDEPSITGLIKTVLESEDYIVGLARTGRQCLELLAEGWGPDLIIMDLMMPQMNGHQAIEVIKGDSRWSHIPILAMSAGTNLRMISLDSKQPDGMLPKPFDLDALSAAVALLLHRQEENNTPVY